MKKVRNAMSNAVKSQDLFGHPIRLNFNQRGSRHKTVVGGFLSIFIRIALVAYVVVVIHRMFSYGDNKLMTSYAMREFDDHEGGDVTWLFQR